MSFIALTYTAPIPRIVVVHHRPVLDTAPSFAEEATSVSNRQVLCARHIVEYDRATWIPPEHLNDR